MRFAIIGAGMAGLSLASMLRQSGQTVEVFEKSRGVGGRMSTRHTPYASIDHGCQFLGSRTPEFEKFLDPLIEIGLLETWTPRIIHLNGERKNPLKQMEPGLERCLKDAALLMEEMLVPVGDMNALCKYLARDVNIRFSTRITHLCPGRSGWELYAGDHNEALGFYDWVILTAPPAQSRDLLPECFKHRAEISKIEMNPCMAVLIVPAKPLDLDFDVAEISNSILSWVALNHKKPGRGGHPALIGHCDYRYSRQVLEQNPEDLKEPLFTEMNRLLGGAIGSDCHEVSVHRWRYAQSDGNNQAGCYVDRCHRLAVAGDWCLGGRVEDAWLSAHKTYQILSNALI